MKTVKFLSMAALIVMGAIFAGCVKINDSVDPVAEDNIVVCTTSINLEEADGTKALTNSGVKTFADGDRIAVIYKNTSNQTVKAVSEAISSGAGTASATFSVTLTNPDNTKAIRYIYPAAMAKATVATEATMDDAGTVDFTNLNNQNGSLTTLGSTLDLCTYDAANWTSGTLPNGTLTNKLAILAITLKNSTGVSVITSDITGMTLSDGTNNYEVTRSVAEGPIYLAIRPTDGAAIDITATDGSKNYTKSLTGKTYAANNGYNVSWRMTEVPAYNPNTTPLTFEAKADGFTVTLTSNLDPLPSLEYSIDGGSWTTYTCNAATPSVDTGHTIAFRGDNTAFFIATGMSAYTSTFSCSQDCYLYGNMMSLLSASDYATATSVGEMAFLGLFMDNTKIYSHDTKQLVLPATTLAPNCYGSMFRGCTALTRAPELPATTLDIACYGRMFYGCTALTRAPELRATTLVNGCYSEMFIGCTSLNSITCLATGISADNCTESWLQGVAATGTFTAANSSVVWSADASGIPSGWARVNAE